MYDWWKMFINNQARYIPYRGCRTPFTHGENVLQTEQWLPRPKGSRPNDDPPHFDMDTFTSLQPDTRTYIDVEYELTVVGTVRGATTTESYAFGLTELLTTLNPGLLLSRLLSGSCGFSNPNGDRSDERGFTDEDDRNSEEDNPDTARLC